MSYLGIDVSKAKFDCVLLLDVASDKRRYNPDVRALYTRLGARGKSKMAALGAAMRKLTHICFGVIKHQIQYRASVQISVQNA